MANIVWQNESEFMVKWLTLDNNGVSQGAGLDPGQSKIMSDEGIAYAGWSFGGAGTPPFELSLVNPPAGYSQALFVLGNLPLAEGDIDALANKLP